MHASDIGWGEEIKGERMMIQTIRPQQAHRLLAAGELAAVDVREPEEYAAGHVPGAKLLPLGQIGRRAEEVLPQKDQPLAVYCRSGRRSAAAVRQLAAMGYTRLYDLGGILSWPYEVEAGEA